LINFSFIKRARILVAASATVLLGGCYYPPVAFNAPYPLATAPGPDYSAGAPVVAPYGVPVPQDYAPSTVYYAPAPVYVAPQYVGPPVGVGFPLWSGGGWHGGYHGGYDGYHSFGGYHGAYHGGGGFHGGGPNRFIHN
jgi:hypothetical protein